MGHDGREVRRYLLGDPLNPVSAGQLAMLPVWPKLLVFYAVLAAAMWYALRRPKGRDLLLTLSWLWCPSLLSGRHGAEAKKSGTALFPFLLPLVIWSAWSAGRERHRRTACCSRYLCTPLGEQCSRVQPDRLRARSEQARPGLAVLLQCSTLTP